MYFGAFMNRRGSALVVFGEKLPHRWEKLWSTTNVVLANEGLRRDVEASGLAFVPLEPLIGAGSIYEASAFAEELSRLSLPDGSRLAKSFIYEGYEMWWTHYNGLFLYFCLPYTQYKELLGYLKDFQSVRLYRPPYRSLFLYYLQAHGRAVDILREEKSQTTGLLPLGILLQVIITLLGLPILIIWRPRLMVFVGDKFEKGKDYDFRMRFIYQELRQRDLPFVEFIRSLESWKTVLAHFWRRRRPVIYSEGVALIGRFCSILSGAHALAKRKFGAHAFISQTDPEMRFRFLIATHYLLGVYDDVWAIRLTKWIMRAIGIKSGLFTAALDRNFHAVLGCKLNAIPTVGILHGVSSRYYNVYDFLPAFDGVKTLSVDTYGLWSEWWKEYYVKNSKAYHREQLRVSGPMRPLEKSDGSSSAGAVRNQGPIRVLFVSEQLAVPNEVMPYLEALLNEPDIKLTIIFRHYRDGFRNWLAERRPELLKRGNVEIVEGEIQKAIGNSDVVVGSHSTAVLEALFQRRVPIFFQTRKWGDYFELKKYDEKHSFFAEDPNELIGRIKNIRFVPMDTIEDLRERYFGDPHKNGSAWVVDQISTSLFVR